MPYLSEDFVANKVAKALAGRAERTFRDSRLTGFALRVRRLADGRLAKTFFVFEPVPGRRNPRKIVIGDHAAWPAGKAREEAQRML